MKKAFSLGVVFALLFSSQVIFAADSTGKRDTATTVELKSTHTINYIQETDIEIDKIKNNKEIILLMDSSSAMKEIIEKVGSPFDYALFSGSETENLDIQSGSVLINGGVHANKSITQRAGDIEINGKLEAVENIDLGTGGSISGEFTINEDAPVIEMQDLSDKFKEASIGNPEEGKSAYFSTAPLPFDPSKRWCDLIVNRVDGTFIADDFKGEGYLGCSHGINSSTGNYTWDINGNELVLVGDRPLYFEGDLQLNVDKISGKGFIVASGNIRFSTSNFASEDIGIYSVNGDVNFSTGAVELKGLIYTPKGRTRADSGAIKVTGSVVGLNVDAGTGNIEINYDGSLGTIKEVKKYENLRRTISVTKSVLQDFNVKLKSDYAGSDVKLNIITYAEKATVAFSDFHNITANDVIIPNEYINSIDLGEEAVNLGDGLRRAYYELSSSPDTTAEKYIIVLAAGEPNRWTQNDTPSTGLFETDDGEALDSQIKMGEQQAKNYAIEIANMIKAANIKSFFIDVNPGEAISGLDDVVAAIGTSVSMYNPEEVTGGPTFDVQLNNALVIDVANDIINEESYIEPKITVEFTEKIPAQVEVKEAPDFYNVTSSGDLVLKSNDKVVLTDAGKKVKVSLGDISIKVKYQEFPVGSNKVVYPKITATYTIEHPLTRNPLGTKEVDIEKLEVDINWSIDVN
jgi:formylmethanofuran dehydrogenase subunit C